MLPVMLAMYSTFSSSVNCSQLVIRVCTKPLITVIGVRNSCEATWMISDLKSYALWRSAVDRLQLLELVAELGR